MAKKPNQKTKRPPTTINAIKTKVERRGYDGLSAEEAKILMEHMSKESKKPIAKNPVGGWREKLEGVMEKVVNAYLEELTEGGGIAKIQAADRLKDMHKEYAREEAETFDVGFVEITEIDGKIVEVDGNIINIADSA